jgi:hypothetical protein
VDLPGPGERRTPTREVTSRARKLELDLTEPLLQAHGAEAGVLDTDVGVSLSLGVQRAAKSVTTAWSDSRLFRDMPAARHHLEL